MSTHNVIEIPLEDLARDPILPPRILNEERLDALCRSMAESGMAEPLVVRAVPEPVPDGPKYLTVLGYRRQLGAGRLGWETVPAVVRDDLDDGGVLQLAFDADKTTESRTALEDCWYYASMCAAGMTQAALAEREEFSEGKASMYVRTGNAITPERIAEAGLAPEDLAAVGIVKLATIASGPEGQLPARILAAVTASSTAEEPVPAFEWTQGRNGIGRATLRTSDVASWTQEERVEFIGTFGPLLAEARRLECLEDPAVAEACSRLEEAHRIALIEAREARTEQLLRLMELNTKLLLAFNGSHDNQPDVGPGTRLPRLRLFRRPLHRVLRWFGAASIIEGKASLIEDSAGEQGPQIRIRFDGEQAA